MEKGITYLNSSGAGGGLEDFAPKGSWFMQELQTGRAQASAPQ